MKIAVATENGAVSAHFGHCEGFTVYEVEGKEIANKVFLQNPGHKPGFLPNYLNDNGVNIIIAGGMGAGAIEIFNQKNIEIITGASGKTDDIVKKYLEGRLTSSASVCRQHMHAGECGEH